MSTYSAFNGPRALLESLMFAVQWRVWLIWIVVLALPAVFGVMPLQAALADALDHLPQAEQLAQGFTLAQFGDLMRVLSDGGGYSVAIIGSLLVLALLAPWMTGVAITAARAQRSPRFGELFAGGLAEYLRQLRLLLWAIVVYLAAFMVFVLVSYWANERASGLMLESSARYGEWLATVVGLLSFVVAHASIEAARAFLVVRPNDGGALRAWWRGVKLLVRRPLSSFGLYLGVLLLGLIVAGLIAILRIQVAAIGWSMLLMALLLTQLGVAATAWGRLARLRALAHLAQDEALQRYR